MDLDVDEIKEFKKKTAAPDDKMNKYKRQEGIKYLPKEVDKNLTEGEKKLIEQFQGDPNIQAATVEKINELRKRIEDAEGKFK
jgi:hypothetical protein